PRTCVAYLCCECREGELRLAGVPVDGELHEARRAVEAQLFLDALAVRLDRLDAEAQVLSDLPRRLAAADQVQHLHLAVAQALDRVDRVLPARDGEALDHARADTVADVDPAREHAAQGNDELIAGRLLHDVAVRAGAQEALGIDRLVVHRQHEHGKLPVLRADLLDQLEAVAVAQRQIEDHDIGPRSLEPEPRLAHVRRLAADNEIGLLLQELDEPFPDDRMIVDDEDRSWPSASLLHLVPKV